VRQRLEVAFDDAILQELCSSNPARVIRRKLTEQATRRSRQQFRSLPYAEKPDFMAQLRAQRGVAARALEFGILTASRRSEVVYATWDEFDLQSST
jgi:integrase